jgi:hypothetical protein
VDKQFDAIIVPIIFVFLALKKLMEKNIIYLVLYVLNERMFTMIQTVSTTPIQDVSFILHGPNIELSYEH